MIQNSIFTQIHDGRQIQDGCQIAICINVKGMLHNKFYSNQSEYPIF